MKFTSFHQSPIGIIEITASTDSIKSLYFVDEKSEENPNPILVECVQQLDEYFTGKRQNFTIQLNLDGTAFQKSVWELLCKIPFGQTVSYMDIAKSIGNPRAVRAVGLANGKNPVSIIVPCHRVIGSNGKLIGYGGGLWRKQWLLKHEGVLLF